MTDSNQQPITSSEAQTFLSAVGFEMGAEDWRSPTEITVGLLTLEKDRIEQGIERESYQADIRILGRLSLHPPKIARTIDHMVIG